MNKEEILNVIKKNIVAAVDDISESDIDPMKSMAEYGASSLDVVEVVSNSMRQLKIKIPRTELADIKNIDELANKFFQNSTHEV